MMILNKSVKSVNAGAELPGARWKPRCMTRGPHVSVMSATVRSLARRGLAALRKEIEP